MVEKLRTSCCIAGGGPAGMMLGFLLARAGVEVVVLEKHADFLRDFRGDTIHPSTLEVIHELGLLEDFLKRPHSEVREAAGQIGDESVVFADFTHLPTRCKFIAFMPQWDFLDFLVEHGARYPTFKAKMQAEVVDLLKEEGSIAGVRARTPEGDLEVRADLVVGCDGRQSIVRERAGLEIVDLGAPMDVLWFRLSRRPKDSGQVFGRIVSGRIMVMLNRGDYWQCGFIIRKGGIEEVKQRGLESFRQEIAAMVPYMSDRVGELKTWEDIRLLTVAVDRLRKWYRPGLLCIGDAAHAMSPVGGVGINLAIQDAVATANLLAARLSRGTVSLTDLQRVQFRREFPTRATQALQVFIQSRVIGRVLGSQQQLLLPWPIKLLNRWPFLRRIPARVIGVGFRPEHVKTADMFVSSEQ
jgi:2-polyprenyl-6-methoxyphenol hydroxylase-like FAD-dependent oxidoreductase